MQRQIALEILIGAALVSGALVVFVMTSQCGAAAPEPRVPDTRYVTGLGYCVADIALAKSEMKLANVRDGGANVLNNAQRGSLRERYDACEHNVEELFGYNGVALDAGVQ